jgi:hypothetical protein
MHQSVMLLRRRLLYAIHRHYNSDLRKHVKLNMDKFEITRQFLDFTVDLIGYVNSPRAV